MKKIDGMILLALVAALFSTYTPSSVNAKTRPDTVLEVLKGNKDLSQFADYIKDAGLEKNLSDKKARLTLFVPSNEAMKKMPDLVKNRISDNEGEKKKLTQFHIINGSIVFAANIKGRKASPGTVSGEMLNFDGTGKTLVVGNAQIIKQNQSARNGVIHIIDKVLTPPSYTAKEKEPAPEESLPTEPAELNIPAPTAPTAPTVPAVNSKNDKAPTKEKVGVKDMLKKLFKF